MDFTLHRPAHLSDIPLRLIPQKSQLLRGVQTNPQKVQDFLVILLQIHHNLPQVIPIRQIVHPEQAVAKKIIKLSTTDLPEGWTAHAVRHDVALVWRKVWRIFENTHEAIIPPDRWDLAQYALFVRRRTDSTGTANPLTGKLVCAECGAFMNNRRSKAGKTGRHSDDFYDCLTYSHGNGCCGHYISTENVRELVLQAIRSVGRYAIGNEAEFAEKVREVSALRHADEVRGKQAEADHARRRIAELDTIIQRLYERFALGKIPESRFEALIATYEKEQASLHEVLSRTEKELASYQADTDNIDRFMKAIRKYRDPDTLAAPMLNELIEKIVVHASVILFLV